MHCHGCYENNPIVVAVPVLLWGEETDKVELIHVATKLTLSVSFSKMNKLYIYTYLLSLSVSGIRSIYIYIYIYIHVIPVTAYHASVIQ
jgi:hypothetical protein